MRILYLITNNSLADGIARHILNISAYFVKHPELGIEIAVCIAMSPGDLTTSLESAGVRVYHLNGTSGHSFKIFWNFRKVIKDFKPDMIHSHVMALMERVFLSLFRRGIPIVGTVHGITMEHLGGKFAKPVTLKQKIERSLYRLFSVKTKKMIYISRGVQDFYHGDKDSVYIYNPMEFKEVLLRKNSLHKILEISEDSPVIGTACRISAQKDPEAFTEVMCMVLSSMTTAHAVVCGSSEENMKSLEEIVSKYNVSERFHWMGYRKDAPELVKDFDCFVMTSVTEGLPTALLEAMANKIPVAFMETNGGMKDIAEIHRTEGPIGICVDAGECEKMAQMIIEMLNQKTGAALAERAYTVCKKHFSMPVVIEKLQKVYIETVNRW